MDGIKSALKAASKDLFSTEVEPELSRPDEQFGDYSTNVAMQLAGQLKKNPREIAVALASKLHGQDGVEEVNVAGPGFINLKLTDQALFASMSRKTNQTYFGKIVVAEYSDPNPFKILHAGHLYTSVVGDAIANLLQNAGAKVHKVNFGGDVGLHVGKSMWAILKQLGGENPDKLEKEVLDDVEFRAGWLSARYVEGSTAYEEDETAKAKIIELNKRIYKIHEQDDHDSALARIYWKCREWSYEYFEFFYKQLGTSFEKYYPESETAKVGLKTVKQHIGDVFEESKGAVIFNGEKYGLHTRVFINSEGLPTYETKDVGLIIKKYEDYHFDESVVITGNEQEQYMAVVLKAVEQFAPELAKTTKHLTHGLVKLKGNVKMSSRKGNVIRAIDIVEIAANATRSSHKIDDKKKEKQIVFGAIKYAFLKQRAGGDIIYDPDESVSLLGNSGPYLQYAHARARSILEKVTNPPGTQKNPPRLDEGERSLARKISEYPEVVEKATEELMPHHIATYLYELAQTFNRFYEKSRVIGDERQALRLRLVAAYADVLKDGLRLLGIVAPDKM